MHRRLVLTVALAVVLAGRPSFGQAPTPTAEPRFDPARDATQDIRAAILEARRTRKRIILDVGGEWCSWCHALDRYFAEHADARALREKHYVWLKINFSPENRNEALLSRYPPIKGYPHLFVLESDGKLLQSQDTSLLEQGPSYNLDKMREFLIRWAPASPNAGPVRPDLGTASAWAVRPPA